MVVTDQYTQGIAGFAAHAGAADGPDLCRLFNEASSGQCLPRLISSDNDPLFQYRQWKANLNILDIGEVKWLPNAPMSHPFVERLIGSVRRQLPDHTLFWTQADLESQLRDYQLYFNNQRCHSSHDGSTPVEISDKKVPNLRGYCRE
jgi:putative transposase